MTEETLKQGQALLQKIKGAKERINWFMNAENHSRYNPAKEDYYAEKVKDWTLKLDALRKQFKEL